MIKLLLCKGYHRKILPVHIGHLKNTTRTWPLYGTDNPKIWSWPMDYLVCSEQKWK